MFMTRSTGNSDDRFPKASPDYRISGSDFQSLFAKLLFISFILFYFNIASLPLRLLFVQSIGSSQMKLRVRDRSFSSIKSLALIFFSIKKVKFNKLREIGLKSSYQIVE